MTQPRAIMIFAAGLGTRMRPLTDTRPKPLIQVAGKALIDHALDLLPPLNLTRKVMNLHAMPDQMRSHLIGQDITFSDETAQLLETGGGLRHALPLLGTQPVFTLNTDAVWLGPNPLIDLAAAWDPSKMDALLHVVPRARAIGCEGPSFLDLAADGTLSRGSQMAYTGAQIIKLDRIAAHPNPIFSLNTIWDEMQAEGRLHGLATDVKWCDVGRPANIALAENMLRADVS